ncbi:hypothetical protein COB55_03775 [Candidatus Wolfebacteria bacterium]|nr:MAG: hypothetical protein COB55_03775 [Candidatus Wolfebacteria bacterium]
MILILSEEHIIPHYRSKSLSEIEINDLRVNIREIFQSNTVVLKRENKVKILKTRNTDLTGKVIYWDDCVRFLLEL